MSPKVTRNPDAKLGQVGGNGESLDVAQLVEQGINGLPGCRFDSCRPNWPKGQINNKGASQREENALSSI